MKKFPYIKGSVHLKKRNYDYAFACVCVGVYEWVCVIRCVKVERKLELGNSELRIKLILFLVSELKIEYLKIKTYNALII